MTQKERNIVTHAIRWTIDNYPDIIAAEKYGKEPTIGLLCDEFEKELDELYKH